MIIRLENIAQYVGQTVTIEGWLYDKTDKGKLQFLQVRDGTDKSWHTCPSRVHWIRCLPRI